MQIFDGTAMIHNTNASVTINAGDTIEVDFPATFTPDRKASYDYLVFSRLSDDQEKDNDTIQGEIKSKWSASITEVKGQQLRISPNPSNGLIDVDLPNSLIGNHYAILDIRGSELMRGTMETKKTSLDLTALPAGVYFLACQHSSGTAKVRFILSE
jgi:hypothetical protein